MRRFSNLGPHSGPYEYPAHGQIQTTEVVSQLEIALADKPASGTRRTSRSVAPGFDVF